MSLVSSSWGTGWCRAPVAVLWCLLLAACAPSSPLARPIVLGASVSAGARAEHRVDGAGAGIVDLAAALDASLVDGDRFSSLADGAAFLDPVGSIDRQVAATTAQRATLVVAVDALFWCVYGPAGGASERRDRLRDGLDELGNVGVPILVADLPDLRPAVARMLGPGAVPDDATLAEANASIRAWVEADPRRCLLSLQPLLDGAGGETLRSAFAADGLHASAQGEVQLAIAVLERLAACKVVPRDAFLADRDAVLARVRPRTIVPAPSSREASRATIDRVAALRRAEATLDIALASGDRSQLQRAFRALFDPELVEERAFFQVQLLPPQLAKHPEAREELVSVYRPLRLAAARPDSGPAEQATVIEIALILGDSEAAIEAAAALGRLADRDAKAPVPVERSLSRRLRELVYVTTSDRSPLVAAATVVDVRLAIAETVDRATRSQRAGSIAARQGVAVRSRSDAELLAQLAKVLEAAGRTQDAATVRAAERQSGP